MGVEAGGGGGRPVERSGATAPSRESGLTAGRRPPAAAASGASPARSAGRQGGGSGAAAPRCRQAGRPACGPRSASSAEAGGQAARGGDGVEPGRVDPAWHEILVRTVALGE